MKKVLDKALEAKITEINKASKKPSDAAAETLALLKELQDASGLKVCMNVSKGDAAYREV